MTKLSLAMAVTLYSINLIAAEQIPSEKTLQTINVNETVLDSTTEGSSTYSYSATSAGSGFLLPPALVPQSVDVLTSERIQDAPGTYRVTDAINGSTGIKVYSFIPDRVRMYARKMLIDQLQTDGVPMRYNTNYTFGDNLGDTSIYDRVEVVRGANGVLSGAGNPSASINLVRKAPVATPFLSISGAVGSYDLYHVGLDAGGALSKDERIRARISLAEQKRHGYLDRYKENKASVYTAFDFDVGDSGVFGLGANYQDTDIDGTMWSGVPLKYDDGTPTNFSQNVSVAPSWAGVRTKLFDIYGRYTHVFENGAELELGHDHQQARGSRINVQVPSKNYLNSATNVFTSNDIRLFDGKRTQDFSHIKANGEAEIFSLEHELSLTLSTSRQSLNMPVYTNITGSQISGDITNFNPQKPSFTSSPVAADILKTYQHSAVFMDRIKLSDKFALIAGLRYTHFDEKSTGYNDSGKKTWASYKPYRLREDDISKYLALTYEFAPNSALYAAYTDIFSPQNAFDEQDNPLKPTIGKSYEIGAKSQFESGLLLSASLFHIIRNNLAVSTGKTRTDGSTIYASANGATTNGFELSAQGKVLKNLDIYAGYSYVKSRDADKNEIDKNLPNSLFKFFASYEVSSINGLSVGAGLNWQSKTEVVKNGETFKTQSIAVYDALLRYELNKHAKVQLNVNNIFNKRYISGYGSTGHYKLGEPRTFMLSFRYEI
ncbi:TonB-dependent siderophore receptor [Campylobacter sp. 19-13652]|uniref:TonB-dependent siderophore receptor n=1 Tax=Campylobacter sp. 19-13652 TaxID=2840180 RepID=UPI001C7453FA|nr:TonB-dependent siderophore receptor [Campylobacter sp. 19-13652]BCX79976.1 TonB-dependent receptor [Campylobacter sp. 19-13652]